MLHIATTDAGYVTLAERARRLIEETLKARRERRARYEARQAFLNLKHLDDRTLDDIGVTRAEVYNAAELPMDVNAARALHQMAAERKARQQPHERH